MHVDKGNVGPSYIVGVGDFEGGKLWVHRQQYKLQQELARGYSPEELVELYPTSDGTVAGWEMPWEEKIGVLSAVKSKEARS